MVACDRFAAQYDFDDLAAVSKRLEAEQQGAEACTAQLLAKQTEDAELAARLAEEQQRIESLSATIASASCRAL